MAAKEKNLKFMVRDASIKYLEILITEKKKAK
jgi:hypothetical protein